MGKQVQAEVKEQIERSEHEYHVRVLQQLEAAQTTVQSWSTHLSEKYKLTQGDTIDIGGNIHRGKGTE